MALRGLVGLSGSLRAGDLVEVRSADEILATLDREGKLEGMPFQPEMLAYCGRQFRVSRVAHKACDTVHYSGIRRVRNAVHLEGLRCNGVSHGGCQAACLFYWKEGWLRFVTSKSDVPRRPAARGQAVGSLSLAGLERATRRSADTDAEVVYQCQVTELLRASRPWAWWSPRQYLADVWSGNWPAKHVLRILVLAAVRRAIAWGTGTWLLIALYDRMASRFRMPAYAVVANQLGPIPKGELTPDSAFSPAPGDWVRVRSRSEIVATLNRAGRNRGMWFDTEMVRYCGGVYRVSHLVTQIIDEGTGKMLQMKNPCVALEGVICKAEYSGQRLMCPRAIVPFWRPLWLERAPNPEMGRSASVSAR